MGKKDIVSKDIINTLIKDIAKYILEIEVNKVSLIDKEFQRVEDRRADVVANVDDKFILHIEIQNQNDKKMPLRMMRYYTDIKSITNLPIKQYLIYIGKYSLSMPDFIKDVDFTYKYNIIDMKKIDCEKFIKIDTPDSLVLAILCDFKGKDKQEVINYIIKRIEKLTDENGFRKYLLMLDELSENRDLKKHIKKGLDMLTDINIEKSSLYELAFERGERDGLEKGIQKGIQKGQVQGLYLLVKDPKKISELTGIDETEVIKIIEEIKKEK